MWLNTKVEPIWKNLVVSTAYLTRQSQTVGFHISSDMTIKTVLKTINLSIVLLLPLTSVPGDIPSIQLLLVLNHRVILFRGGLLVLPLHNFSFDQQTCSECRQGQREMSSPAPCLWDDSVKMAKERDLITKAEGHAVFGGRVSPCDRLLELFCWHLCLISLIFSSQPEDRDGAFVRLPCSSTDQGCRRINL